MRKLFFVAACAAVALAGCKQGGNKEAATGADSVAMHVASNQVAYINIDSLVQNYDLYKDLRDQYEVKAKKIDGEISSKGRGLEKDIVDFQTKASKGLMTTSTAQNMQADLEKRQQAFMQQREKAMNEMAEEERVMLNQIHFSIKEFLSEFNSDYRYGMIISTSEAGPILNADPSLEITAIVLDGLNKKYAAEKASQPKK